MKLWLISQPDKNLDYGCYDSAIVAAETEEQAKVIHPSGWDSKDAKKYSSGTWCDIKNVSAKCIGTAKKGTKKGIVLSSFING